MLAPDRASGRNKPAWRRAPSATTWLSLAAALLLLTPLAQAQYFGRNKVLWEQFEFEILNTAHFSIYAYPSGSAIAPQVGGLAERWYGRLSPMLDHELQERNPLIVYRDHADFQQTLTTSGLIGESTGGFTESLQNRVVLPLTGINADNDHVLGHELAHAFQFDMLRETAASPVEPGVQRLPLWLIEGLAEYLSQGRHDAQTAMWMRDAVLHDALPDPGAMHRLELSPYQYGQAFWAYVGGRWSDGQAVALFKRAARVGLEAATRDVLGIERRALLENFHTDLTAAYEPVLADRRAAAESAEPLIHADARGGRLNIAPSLSPDGTRLAFLSTLELFAIELFLADATTGEVIERLVAADADPHFDALSFVQSSVAWSPGGERIAFTVFARGRRQIVIYDVERGAITQRLEAGGLKGIGNPAWSPDGRRIAFSAGNDRGATDLYSIEIDTGRVARLTADAFTAIQPAYSPDGRTIAFVTDRGPGTDLDRMRYGDLQLALLDVESGRVQTLPVFTAGKHIDPHFSGDGESLYFIAAPDGVPDLFRYDLDAGTAARMTTLQTGVTGVTDVSPALSVASRSDTLAFSVLENGRLNIYRMGAARQRSVDAPNGGPDAGVLPPAVPTLSSTVSEYLRTPSPAALDAVPGQPARRPYDPALELAHVGPATLGVSVDSYGTGVGGSLSAYFTDTLATRQLVTTVYGGSTGGYLDFEDAIGGEAMFLNQSRRLQWGALGSRLPYISGATFVSRGTIDIDGTTMPAYVIDDVIELVTATEAALIGQYPLSLNRRFEASLGLRHLSFERQVERLVIPAAASPFRVSFDLPSPAGLDLQTLSLAYVEDTSYFGFASPLRGQRLRLESDWTSGDLDYQTALIDYRRYLFANPLTFAVRALHIARRGDDAEDTRLPALTVGSDQLVRGYALGSFELSECTPLPASSECPEYERLRGSRIAVLNVELRIPLLGNRDFGFFEAPVFPTEGVVFIDVGAAWSAGQSVDWRLDRDTTDRVPVVSAGLALRTVLAGVVPIQLFYAAPLQRPQEDRMFGFLIATGW